MQFVPIQNVDLEADSAVSFDLFVALPKNRRVVLYRRQGEVLEGDRLVRLSRFDEGNLVIRREDYAKFVAYVSDRLRRLLDMGSGKENHLVVEKAVGNLLRNTFDSNDPTLVRSMMDNLNDISEAVIDNALSEFSLMGRRAYRRLVNLAASGTDFQKHPVNVASLAVMMAFGSGYSSQKTLSDIAMAALLHDLGLAKLPAELALQAHRKQSLGTQQQKVIAQHIDLSLQVIQEKKIVISHLTRTMIEQHHEQFDGNGYPMGLAGLQVSPYAQILNMADAIDQKVFGAHAEAANLGLRRLFEGWSREMAFEPRLLGQIRNLFFAGTSV